MTRAEFLIVIAHAIFSVIGLTLIALQNLAISRMAVQLGELIVKTH